MLNPLRYRGYYFDSETGFYYLQSRYYDPEICRFINADGYASTGQGILGNNMFAYCNNKPVVSVDYGGSVPKELFSYGFTASMFGGGGGGRSAPVAPTTITPDDIKEQGTEIAIQVGTAVVNAAVTVYRYFYNTDEEAVVKSKGLVFYKGVPYIKTTLVPDGSAFTLGAVFMSPTVTDHNLVRHEYGHAVHMKIIGVTRYIGFVAIPSAIQFWRHKDDPSFNYYSQPWEYIADIFGRVDPAVRNYLPNAKTNAFKYLLKTIIG